MSGRIYVPRAYKERLRHVQKAAYPHSLTSPYEDPVPESPLEMAGRLGIQPDPWQEQVLTSDADRMLLLCGRQTGKTSVTAMLATYEIISRINRLVLCVSPSLKQSQEIFRKAHGYWQDLGEPIRSTSETALSLTLAQGSRLISLPGSERTVRGWSADLVIVDEAALVPDELYYALRPVLAATGGKLIALSTPRGKRGWFHHEWEQGGDDWERIKVRSDECPRISKEFLEAERKALGSYWYSQEYEVAWGDNQTSVFRSDDIEACVDPEIEPLHLGGMINDT
jgi:hypothetical protein